MTTLPWDRPINGRWVLALALLLVLPMFGVAQHSEQDIPSNDTLRGESKLYEVMKRGEVDGRFRQYTMVTINDGAPRDYHAVAFGGTLGFTSQRWHGARFKLSGGYTFDLASSDLTVPDPVTGLPNRYEIGLYDVNDPRITNDLAYLHEFQLDWLATNGRTNLIFGKQELNTPFLNPQDGRMHPSLFEGLWARHRTAQGTRLEGGWIYRVAPRGTREWYPVAESMSVYPTGKNVDGEASMYGDVLRSAGIFALSARHPLGRKLALSLWDVYTENIFNTAMLQLDAGEKEDRWSLSGMAIKQDPTATGNNAVDSLAYMPEDQGSWAFSGRLRNVLGKFRWQLNYTRITAHGRYLMPREWGRDPFYTFLPRERNEGLGDVDAATLNLIWKDTRSGWRIEVDGGLYRLPELSDARLNKYAMPSYTQATINAQYQFRGAWQGLAAQFIGLAKVPITDADPTERQSFNKVNMLHIDLIINYVF
ncbi:MAG TPA: hypothetical protein PLB89_09695 [Flavobacteriales bacterium]|nr:hypothetical protein [Flavobacteriales bacterium]